MLTKAMCLVCGGVFDIDSDLEQGRCIHCRSKFLVQEAIQKFKAEADQKLKANAGGAPTLEGMLLYAKQKLSDGEWKNAENLYEEILKGAPTCHEAWWGRFESEGGRKGFPLFFHDFEKRESIVFPEYGRVGFPQHLGLIGGFHRTNFEPWTIDPSDTYGDFDRWRSRRAFKEAVAALDKRDLQSLYGRNLKNFLNAIKHAPEGQKFMYRQRLEDILKDCRRIAGEIREVFVKYDEALKEKLGAGKS